MGYSFLLLNYSLASWGLCICIMRKTVHGYLEIRNRVNSD